LSVPSVDPNQRRRNLMLLVVLVAVAALLYVSVMFKIAKNGF